MYSRHLNPQFYIFPRNQASKSLNQSVLFLLRIPLLQWGRPTRRAAPAPAPSGPELPVPAAVPTRLEAAHERGEGGGLGVEERVREDWRK